MPCDMLAGKKKYSIKGVTFLRNFQYKLYT